MALHGLPHAIMHAHGPWYLPTPVVYRRGGRTCIRLHSLPDMQGVVPQAMGRGDATWITERIGGRKPGPRQRLYCTRVHTHAFPARRRRLPHLAASCHCGCCPPAGVRCIGRPDGRGGQHRGPPWVRLFPRAVRKQYSKGGGGGVGRLRRAAVAGVGLRARASWHAALCTALPV